MKKLLFEDNDKRPQQKLRQAAVPRQEERCCEKAPLSEEDLSRVSAAGDASVPTMNPDVLLGRHDIPADTKEHRP